VGVPKLSDDLNRTRQSKIGRSKTIQLAYAPQNKWLSLSKDTQKKGQQTKENITRGSFAEKCANQNSIRNKMEKQDGEYFSLGIDLKEEKKGGYSKWFSILVQVKKA